MAKPKTKLSKQVLIDRSLLERAMRTIKAQHDLIARMAALLDKYDPRKA